MVQVVTGDSQEEVIIFRDRQTDRHIIIIYISSSSHTGCTSVGGFICVLLLLLLETPSIFTDFLTTHVLIDDHPIEM